MTRTHADWLTLAVLSRTPTGLPVGGPSPSPTFRAPTMSELKKTAPATFEVNADKSAPAPPDARYGVLEPVSARSCPSQNGGEALSGVRGTRCLVVRAPRGHH